MSETLYLNHIEPMRDFPSDEERGFIKEMAHQSVGKKLLQALLTGGGGRYLVTAAERDIEYDNDPLYTPAWGEPDWNGGPRYEISIVVAKVREEPVVYSLDSYENCSTKEVVRKLVTILWDRAKRLLKR